MLIIQTSSYIDENGTLLIGQFRPPTSFMSSALRSDNNTMVPMDVQKYPASVFPEHNYDAMPDHDFGGGDD
ncbi:hypothetical protein EON65_50245, partial [archaeon]